MANRKHGGLVTVSNRMLERDAGARHQRRKRAKQLAKLMKKHPTEVAQVLKQLEDRHGNNDERK